MATTGISSVVSSQLAGFDTTAAVEGILTPQLNEITQFEQRQTDITDKQNLLTTFNADLQALRTTATAMADSTNFFSYSATLSSSNASVPATNLLAISGTNSVAAGNHTIVVDQIAAAPRLSSASAVISTTTGLAATTDAEAL